eukprot:TRINITY_DN66557_c9_g1_i1.p2 TRINITY_DN66557_c9_g1~~TRINITY_DN66557_c9_g1_i1.p2  ORF type:complete len:102 (+),score=49.62 TRINITY_DN66557_c9_g1_i1:112-417(+)
MGVLVWLYEMGVIVGHFMDLQNKVSKYELVMFVADLFFALMTFIAAIAAASKCQEKITGTNDKLCDHGDGSNFEAGAAFSFFTSFILMGSTYLSYLSWRTA